MNQKAMIFLAASARDVRARAEIDEAVVPSPCMSVCQMDEALGLCEGCLRTLDEIRAWGNADAVFKRQVWGDIEARIAQHLDRDDAVLAPPA
ncbi:MAG: DUF1289 domain-containing protein [Rhodoferax sp.]|uniref:DUF1289 domain-containing protein n=1 Tax=Rhodoferax sp. TaxID=50421 RepID=UPI0026220EF9|nr:DUF1289 domain-containing protein [Rhodoferax sp.]MDD2881524.1 DUF1289 domain-containing protein [Rhodoferax sp.]